MKRVAIVSQDGKGNFPIPYDGPWLEFWKVFAENQFQIVQINQDPDFIIFNNVNWKNIHLFFRFRSTRKALIIWEPKVSNWLNHVDKIRRKFTLVIIFSELWRLNERELIYNWPQRIESQYDFYLPRKRLGVMIASRKWSFVSGEQYSLRTETLRNSYPLIDLYGYGWNKKFLEITAAFVVAFLKGFPFISTKAFANSMRNFFFFPRSYKGISLDKLQTLSEYRIAVIIENSSDYVSEKLVDAVYGGCVPIYIGPRLEQFGFPRGIAKEFRGSEQELGEIIRDLLSNNEECEQILKIGKEFIDSSFFMESFGNSRVLTKIAQNIVTRIED